MNTWFMIYLICAFIAMIIANHPKYRFKDGEYAFIALGLMWPIAAIMLSIFAIVWSLKKSTTFIADTLFWSASKKTITPQKQATLQIPPKKQDSFEISGKL